MTRAPCTTALLLLAALAACDGGGGGGDVVLGVAGPLSQASGASLQKAVLMAVDEINAAGGVDGDSLRLELKDDRADKNAAIEVARALRNDPRVLAVVGHVQSGATLAAAPVYNMSADAAEADSLLEGTTPLAQVSPASSSVDVTRAGEYTFRIAPTDEQHAPALAAWARQLGRSRAAVLYSNDDYGRGVANNFATSFREMGGQVVSRDPYLPSVVEAAGGLEPYLARVFRRGADALVIAGPADGALDVVRTARRMGFAGPILGGDGLTSLKDAGEVADGLFVSSAYLPDRDTEESRRFVQKYQERYGELPDHRGAMAYDLVHLLAREIRGGARDREAVRRALASVQGSRAYEGVSGHVEFDENGDVVIGDQKDVAVGVVRGGRLVTARQ